MSLASTIRMVLAPPHPAGKIFIYAGAAVAVVGGLILGGWLFWPAALFTAFCLYFFRDPERVPPGRPGAVVAPADGRIVLVGPAVPPAELGLGDAPRWRVAIFLSVLDVHVNRMPVEGRITRIAYRAGAFVNAALDLAVVQIAGLIARRIICTVREGQDLGTGERFGIIRFGSRTDLYLPPGVRPLVAVGQTTIGGETVIAELPPVASR